jgi:hypothetical protein
MYNYIIQDAAAIIPFFREIFKLKLGITSLWIDQ